MTGERGLQWAQWTRGQFASAVLVLLAAALLGGLMVARHGVLAQSRGAVAAGAQPAPEAPPLFGDVLPEAAVGPVSAAIGASDPAYRAHTVAGLTGAASAYNRRQGFHTSFTAAGVAVASRHARLDMRAAFAGFSGASTALPAVAPRAASNRVSYRYPGLEAWYVNGPYGLEQGFTVARAPSSASSGGLYTVELALGGTVSAPLTTGGTTLMLRSQSGGTIRYGGLRSFDANHKSLPSWLSFSDGTLALHVQTGGAHFPVTIDPVLAEEGLIIELGEAEGEAPEKPSFGRSVALSSDGTTALVGAPDGVAHTGAAWVFHREGAVWSQQGKKLSVAVPGEEGGCEEGNEEGEAVSCAFGRSVALSGDGNTALIGAPRGGTKPGVAWIFNRSGGVWTKEETPLVGPEETGQQNFGFSVSLSLDGNHALIGAPIEHGGRGEAYLFERLAPGSPWSKEGTPLISEGQGSSGKFGYSVALSEDGQKAIVGAPLDAHKGTAFIFEHQGNEWPQVAGPLTGKEESGEARFGESVAMSGDGSTVMVAAPKDSNKLGAVWTWVEPGSEWIQFGTKLVGPAVEKNELSNKEEFGSGIALSADGTHALVGAPRATGAETGEQAGVAWLYEASKSEWMKLAPALEAGKQEVGRGQFGKSVAMTAKAETMLAGAPHEAFKAGAVFLFGQRPEVKEVKSPPDSTLKNAKGRLSGGNKVAIIGYNLEEAIAVWFGGEPNKAEIVGHFKLPSGLEGLEVVAPPGKQDGELVDVTVQTAAWLSQENSNDHYTYNLVAGEEKKGGGGGGSGGSHKKKEEKEVPFGQLGIVLPGGTGTPGGTTPPPPAACSVALHSSSVMVNKHAGASVSLTGHGSGKCGGRLTLQVRTGSGHHVHTIASGPYVAFGGRTVTVSLKLNSTGRALLRAHHGRLKARLVILKSYPAPARSLLASVNVLLSKHK
jgi:hypothetical protein